MILVDELDRPTGLMEKMEAHRKGALHRAFSVFIFTGKGAFLMQQRAATKYHSPGLWTNTCCSHPLPGEETAAAAHRRLKEEMGFSTPLSPAFSFVYRAVFDNDLVEHEFDHVFTGIYDGDIAPDSREVGATRYQHLQEIEEGLRDHPHHYTPWFHLAFPRVKELHVKLFNGAGSPGEPARVIQ